MVPTLVQISCLITDFYVRINTMHAATQLVTPYLAKLPCKLQHRHATYISFCLGQRTACQCDSNLWCNLNICWQLLIKLPFYQCPWQAQSSEKKVTLNHLSYCTVLLIRHHHATVHKPSGLRQHSSVVNGAVHEQGTLAEILQCET